MDGWMDGQIRSIDGCKDRQTCGNMDGQTNKQMDRQDRNENKDGQMAGLTD